MNKFISTADQYLQSGRILLTTKTEWDFIKNPSKTDGDVFKKLTDQVKEIGSSGYKLMMAIGIIGLVFAIIFTAVTLLTTSNAQKKEEKKSHAFTICLAGIVIFSVFAIIGFFQSIGSGLDS